MEKLFNILHNKNGSIRYSTILGLLTIPFIILACSPLDDNSKKRKKSEPRPDNYYEYKSGVWNSMEYKVVEKTVDDCEYIIVFGTQGVDIEHKANCENYYHQQNK